METFSMLLKKFKKKMLINAKNKYFFNHHTKIRLEKNSYLEKYFSQDFETSPQYTRILGAYLKNKTK